MTAMRPRRSLTGHLLAWALGALVLVWTSFIGFAYLTGEHEADELTDGHLASVSSLLLPLVPRGLKAAAAGRGSARVRRPARHRAAGARLPAVHERAGLGRAGRLIVHTGRCAAARFDSPEGFATHPPGQAAARTGGPITRWDEARQHKVMVLLSLRERDDLASDIAAQVMEPGLWLLPVVALVLGLAVHRGLRPLRALAQRGARAGHPARRGAGRTTRPSRSCRRPRRPSTGWWPLPRGAGRANAAWPTSSRTSCARRWRRWRCRPGTHATCPGPRPAGGLAGLAGARRARRRGAQPPAGAGPRQPGRDG
jgi:hypothetical protein